MRPGLILLLTLPPFLWGSNAIVGKVAAGSIPPITLNTLRWLAALVVLLPFAWRSMHTYWPVIRLNWRVIVSSGFWGITCYNALQYLALNTSSPINVSLIGAASPIFLLVIGQVLFAERANGRSMLGAAVSLLGVACIIAQGSFASLGSVQFVRGDLFMLAGTFTWSLYTWLLRRQRTNLPMVPLLISQIIAGLLMSLPFVALEQAWGNYPAIEWGLKEVAIVAYIGVFPSVVAYFCWHKAVSRTSAQLPVFFNNLTSIFTVALSALMLGEYPQGFHYAGLMMILTGIVLAQPRRPDKTRGMIGRPAGASQAKPGKIPV